MREPSGTLRPVARLIVQEVMLVLGRSVALVVALVVAAMGLTGPSADPAMAADGDPLRDLQWNLDHVRAEAAWPRSIGSGQIIAVVDTGLQLAHPDLADRIVGGATFVDCPQEPDGCGDGSWSDGTRSAHGTHVAGIAAATAGNGEGIAGVAPGARLLAVESLASDGDGSEAEVAAGIRWATRNGADVINLSLGADPGAQLLAELGAGQTLREAIREAIDAGVVVVAAAGNDVASICSEPAYAGGVVCVVATDRGAAPAAYSNLAISQDMRVVAAPGGTGVGVCSEEIVSTWPVTSNCGLPGGYARASGTSMAAPHVAGVAALLRAQGRDADEVIEVLLGTSRNPMTGARGVYDPSYGYGIVDAAAAVAAPLAEPVVQRAAGMERVATAAEVSRRTHHRADTVVLARSDEYADALAGAPLATHLRASLLITGPGGLSAPTAEEIRRLGAREAILLGGPGALSPEVVRDLRAMGLDVRRIAGADRFDTAARIAFEMFPTPEVFLVEGVHPDPARGWPDALSASGLAASLRAPILLTTRDHLPAATARELTGDRDVTIVGGVASVSTAVQAEVDRHAGTVRRLAGADRYATSAVVAEEALRTGLRPTTTWLATGRGFVDGLVAGAAAGMEDGILMLVDGGSLDASPQPVSFLERRAGQIAALRLAGGPAAISRDAERRLADVVAR